MRKVLKPFSYGADGIHAVAFTPDSPPSDFGTSTDGLAAAGFISKTDVDDKPAKPTPVAAPIAVPAEAPAQRAPKRK